MSMSRHHFLRSSFCTVMRHAVTRPSRAPAFHLNPPRSTATIRRASSSSRNHLSAVGREQLSDVSACRTPYRIDPLLLPLCQDQISISSARANRQGLPSVAADKIALELNEAVDLHAARLVVHSTSSQSAPDCDGIFTLMVRSVSRLSL
jgi:hypothetical protein